MDGGTGGVARSGVKSQLESNSLLLSQALATARERGREERSGGTGIRCVSRKAASRAKEAAVTRIQLPVAIHGECASRFMNRGHVATQVPAAHDRILDDDRRAKSERRERARTGVVVSVAGFLGGLSGL